MEDPARPKAEVTTTKNLVTRIGIGINALRTAVNKATDSVGTLTGDATAEEIRQTEYLQGKAINIFNEVDEDIQEFRKAADSVRQVIEQSEAVEDRNVVKETDNVDAAVQVEKIIIVYVLNYSVIFITRPRVRACK